MLRKAKGNKQDYASGREKIAQSLGTGPLQDVFVKRHKPASDLWTGQRVAALAAHAERLDGLARGLAAIANMWQGIQGDEPISQPFDRNQARNDSLARAQRLGWGLSGDVARFVEETNPDHLTVSGASSILQALDRVTTI